MYENDKQRDSNVESVIENPSVSIISLVIFMMFEVESVNLIHIWFVSNIKEKEQMLEQNKGYYDEASWSLLVKGFIRQSSCFLF